MSTSTPEWSSVHVVNSGPIPSAKKPGLYPVQQFSYSSSQSGYKQKSNDSNGIQTYKSGKHVSREAEARVKALAILEHAFGQPPPPASIESPNSSTNSSDSDHVMEDFFGANSPPTLPIFTSPYCSSSCGSDYIIEDFFAASSPPPPPSFASPNSSTVFTSESAHTDEDPFGIQDFKSDVDFHRERGTGNQGLLHVEESILGAAPEKPKGPLTVKHAAAMRYEHKKEETAKMKAIKAQQKDEIQKYLKPAPKLVAPKPQEQMAFSTRARKPKPAEDMQEPETVAGMKCQLDLEREKDAQRKALKLMNLLG